MNRLPLLRSALQQDGFGLIPQAVSPEQCESVLQNTFELLGRFVSIPHELQDTAKPWGHPAFHETLARFRKEDPKSFGAMYDSALSSVAMTSLLTDHLLSDRIAYLLDTSRESLSLSGHIQRMDPPHDVRNLYEWHQEQSYYPQNRDGMRGIVVWIPLLDVSLDGGALIVGKGSHREGFVRLKGKKDTELHSTQFSIPEEITNRYESVQFPVRAGDALVMYMTTMHKSGANHTNLFRFVVIGRYHTATADDFIPYRYPYTYNPHIKTLLGEKGYDTSDLP